jgi:hypothetical protein
VHIISGSKRSGLSGLWRQTVVSRLHNLVEVDGQAQS